MFRNTSALLGAGCLLAVAAACSNPATPLSPNAAVPGATVAGPGGETLKIGAPTTIAPTGGATAAFPLTLTVGNVSGKYASFPVTYRYEILNAAGAVVVTGTQSAGTGASTSINVTQIVAFDAPHSWRVRAEHRGAHGPWSAAALFRSPAGSFMRGNEALDLLTDGRTVGRAVGPVVFTAEGALMSSNSAYIMYPLPETLQEGEFSFMATGVDEGNFGDKLKVMSMGQGHGVDVTDNRFRMTLEVRGNLYIFPGMTSFRIITGNADEHGGRISDSVRQRVGWTRSNWHFFRTWWRTGQAGYEIRIGGPTGPIHDSWTLRTSGHVYNPFPHAVYIGAPPNRAGIVNQTHPNMTVKHVWISGSPRPTFPTIQTR